MYRSKKSGQATNTCKADLGSCVNYLVGLMLNKGDVCSGVMCFSSLLIGVIIILTSCVWIIITTHYDSLATVNTHLCEPI